MHTKEPRLPTAAPIRRGIAPLLNEMRPRLEAAGFAEAPSYPRRLVAAFHHPDFVARLFSPILTPLFVCQPLLHVMGDEMLATNIGLPVSLGLIGPGNEWGRWQSTLCELIGGEPTSPRRCNLTIVGQSLHDPVQQVVGTAWVIHWQGLLVARSRLVSRIYGEHLPVPVWLAEVRLDLVAAIHQGMTDVAQIGWVNADPDIGWLALATRREPPADLNIVLQHRQTCLKHLLAEAERALLGHDWLESYLAVLDAVEIVAEAAAWGPGGEALAHRASQHLRGLMRRLGPLISRTTHGSHAPVPGGPGHTHGPSAPTGPGRTGLRGPAPRGP